MRSPFSSRCLGCSVARGAAGLLPAFALLLSTIAQPAHVAGQQPPPPVRPHPPLPPMVVPLDYATPQPDKTATGAAATLPASDASSLAPLEPMRPAADVRRYDTSRFAAPSRAWFAAPAADGLLWAGGTNWKASFDARGFVVHPFLGAEASTNYPVRLQLDRATVGGQPVEIAAVAPMPLDQRVVWERGGVTEFVDLAVGSLEHSFRFDRLPARGELVLELGFASELTAAPATDGITFRNGLGGLDYRHALAIDARGEQLGLTIELHGANLSIRVPAAFVERAALPLIVDPVLSVSTITLGSPWEGLPDLAWDDASQEWLVVWSRQFSLTDMDVWAQRLDVNMSPVGSPFTIDYTADYWFAPRIANLNGHDRYLVVAEVSVDGTSAEHWWIAGCMVPSGPSGVAGNQFDIERGGVVGLPGRNFLPAVGGDPFQSPGASFFTVVWTHETSASNYDIHLKQIDGAGNLRSTLPTVVDGSPANERNPDISKSNGDPASQQRWLIAYQRTFNSADEDLRGAFVSWDGQLQLVAGQFNFPIDSSTFSESAPHPSSPTDRSPVTGSRYQLVGYSRANCTGCAGTWGNVRLIDDYGGVQAGQTLQGLAGALLNVPSTVGGVDSDGSRFAVAGSFTDVFFGNSDNFVATVAFNPFPGVLTASEVALIGSSTLYGEFAPAVVAPHGSGAPPSPRYGLTYAYAAAVGNAYIASGIYVSPFPDECATARPLVAGINGPFTTVGATTSAPAWGCGFNTGQDLWFSYIAPATAPLTFWTCTPTRDFDTVMQVFGGSCGALVPLGCIDDFCSYGSRVSINATFGTTYYVRVGGYNGASGAFDIEVQPGTGLGSIVRNAHGCGPTTIATTGQPRIGGTVTTTLGNVTGVPLLGLGTFLTATPFCGCTVGHDWLVAEVTQNYQLNVPLNVSLIGAVVAMQGADFLGSGGCPSPQLTLTDTMVVTIG